MRRAWPASHTCRPPAPRTTSRSPSTTPCAFSTRKVTESYDVDGDNKLDVLLPTSSGELYALHSNGTPVQSFNGGQPVRTDPIRLVGNHPIDPSLPTPRESLRVPAIGDIHHDDLKAKLREFGNADPPDLYHYEFIFDPHSRRQMAMEAGAARVPFQPGLPTPRPRWILRDKNGYGPGIGVLRVLGLLVRTTVARRQLFVER